jgi:cyclopropane-fatty-acyl-phospholipid synthase
MGAPRQAAWQDAALRTACEFLDALLGRYRKGDMRVRLWDGTEWGAARPRFTLALQHAGALRQMFESASELSLGEAYIYDDFDIEGDIHAALEFGAWLLGERYPASEKVRLAALLHRLPQGRQTERRPAHLRGALHSRKRDQQAISYHYNLPADFYALFLGRQMVYSCAYFQSPDDDLDTAQEQKLDYICRKLRLRAGESLLDIGCGWGALVIHAAGRYGVRAHGITLSAPQAEVAARRIRSLGLEDRCRVEARDYRELEEDEAYDKVVSVGMFEHVGARLLPEYFSRAFRILKRGGEFLNHGIAYSATAARPTASFSDTYVFPDGELVPIHESLRAAEQSGFEVRDVESLREHYALTLRHWVRRLEEHAEEARRITGEKCYRIWRLYMAGSAQRFAAGRTNVYQALLARPDTVRGGPPRTRADWYR